MEELTQPINKILHVVTLEKDLDVTNIVSNTFTLEWPRSSGKIHEYPEIDKAGWFDIELGKKMREGQIGFIDKLIEITNYSHKEKPMHKKRNIGKPRYFKH